MRSLLILGALALLLPAAARGQERRLPPPETPVPRPSQAQGEARRLPPKIAVTPAQAEQARRDRARAVIGTFLATQIDREPLPLTDKVVDDDGTLYLIEFDRLVLSLRDDLTFRAAVRYRRTLFSSDPRGRSRPTPLQNMTVTGTFEVVDDEIRFTPDASNETRGLKMLAGNIRSGRELVIPFHYRNGTQERDRTLVVSRRDNIL